LKGAAALAARQQTFDLIENEFKPIFETLRLNVRVYS
jgi:hypothetical protein